MKKLYRIMDRVFDPLPKELKKKGDKASVVLYYEAADEDYKIYKYGCYRKLILQACLSFLLGAVCCFLLKLL